MDSAESHLEPLGIIGQFGAINASDACSVESCPAVLPDHLATPAIYLRVVLVR